PVPATQHRGAKHIWRLGEYWLRSLPFEFLIARRYVAGVILVKKQPTPAFRVCDLPVGIGNADPGLDRCARIMRNGCEIAAFGFRPCRPGYEYRTMPRNGSVRRYGGQLVELLEPTDEAAIDDRDALDEQQIGEPKGSSFLIEYCHVVVGMSRPARV